jgi:peptidoglycan/LPS O-acetylase OafA/YrhL
VNDSEPGRLLRIFSRGSRHTYTMFLIHFPICLLALSLVGYRLLHFRIADYVALYALLFVVTTVLSYYAGGIVEDRARMKGLALKLMALHRAVARPAYRCEWLSRPK